MNSSFRSAFSLVYILALISISTCQLVGCDVVACGNCIVGNTTLIELGVSEFNATLTSEPFTWTIGIQSTDKEASNQSIWERDYFLGTPPSLQLTSSSSIRSCALFFEGIAGNLSFPGNRSPEFAVGTCSDALDGSCVNDLVSQAQSEMNGLLTTNGLNWTELAICGALETRLQNNPPSSCKLAHAQGWGSIYVRALTGSQAASASQQTNCHPTTGKDYDVALVSSVQFTAPFVRYTDSLALFLGGITPVMTIFYPYSQSKNSSLHGSEIYLNCMKVVGSTARETTDKPPSAAAKRIRGDLIGMVAVILAIVLNF